MTSQRHFKAREGFTSRGRSSRVRNLSKFFGHSPRKHWLTVYRRLQVLYRHERIFLGREDCRPGPKKTICKKLMVVNWFLGMFPFVWPACLCGTRIGCPGDVDCSGTIRKSIWKTFGWTRVTSMHGIAADFMIRGRLTRILGSFRAQGSALTRNVSSSHGSKNLLQRGMRGYYWGKEDCRPGPKKSICKSLMVFHQFLEIAVFVWARALCGTRICCSAAVGCSGVFQNILMSEIEADQGIIIIVNWKNFYVWGR